MSEQTTPVQYAEMLGFDQARIIEIGGTLFLVVGNKRRSEGEWFKQEAGKPTKPFNFDYVEERVVASGKDHAELEASAKKYRHLCGLSWEEYFKELTSQNTSQSVT